MTTLTIRRSPAINTIFGMAMYFVAVLIVIFMKSYWGGGFFFIIGTIGIFNAIDRRPLIVIDLNGLTYGARRKSFVKWGDVETVEITLERSTTNFLSLSLINPEIWWQDKANRYMPRSSIFPNANIKISLQFVDSSVKEIKIFLRSIGKLS